METFHHRIEEACLLSDIRSGRLKSVLALPGCEALSETCSQCDFKVASAYVSLGHGPTTMIDAWTLRRSETLVQSSGDQSFVLGNGPRTMDPVRCRHYQQAGSVPSAIKLPLLINSRQHIKLQKMEHTFGAPKHFISASVAFLPFAAPNFTSLTTVRPDSRYIITVRLSCFGYTLYSKARRCHCRSLEDIPHETKEKPRLL